MFLFLDVPQRFGEKKLGWGQINEKDSNLEAGDQVKLRPQGTDTKLKSAAPKIWKFNLLLAEWIQLLLSEMQGSEYVHGKDRI